MWDFILNPMVTLLVLLYQVFNNNIIMSIVVLTVILRMIMYPVLSQQQESAAKMQEVQPKLKKLQEKYKDDREKLAQAQMELYKENGINPLGGCLPMLLQFPIFIALYSAINFAVASTPFQLVDLSERLLIPGLDGLIPLNNIFLGMDLTAQPQPPSNPWYALALPLLVMATTWLQFKLSTGMRPKPETEEKEEDSGGGGLNQAAAMQQSMGTVMPIMFGFIALSLSVGLSIYFLTSNVVGIIQYSPIGKRVLDRFFGKKETDKSTNNAEKEAETTTKSSKSSKKVNKKNSTT
ncbi:MAG: YidC/Oxa1 family membrane protein insertase [Anaerolineae bacterium]